MGKTSCLDGPCCPMLPRVVLPPSSNWQTPRLLAPVRAARASSEQRRQVGSREVLIDRGKRRERGDINSQHKGKEGKRARYVPGYLMMIASSCRMEKGTCPGQIPTQVEKDDTPVPYLCVFARGITAEPTLSHLFPQQTKRDFDVIQHLRSWAEE